MSRPYPPPQKIFSHWIYMIHLFRFQNGEFHRKVSDFHAWLKDRNIRHVIILFNSIVRVGRRLSRGRQRVITDRQRLFWNFQLVRVLHFFSIFQCFLRVCARFCCVFLRFFCILAHYHSLLLGMDFSSAHTAGVIGERLDTGLPASSPGLPYGLSTAIHFQWHLKDTKRPIIYNYTSIPTSLLISVTLNPVAINVI